MRQTAGPAGGDAGEEAVGGGTCQQPLCIFKVNETDSLLEMFNSQESGGKMSIKSCEPQGWAEGISGRETPEPDSLGRWAAILTNVDAFQKEDLHKFMQGKVVG